jgi:hypothetical protein
MLHHLRKVNKTCNTLPTKRRYVSFFKDKKTTKTEQPLIPNLEVTMTAVKNSRLI